MSLCNVAVEVAEDATANLTHSRSKMKMMMAPIKRVRVVIEPTTERAKQSPPPKSCMSVHLVMLPHCSPIYEGKGEIEKESNAMRKDEIHSTEGTFKERMMMMVVVMVVFVIIIVYDDDDDGADNTDWLVWSVLNFTKPGVVTGCNSVGVE